MAVTPQDIRDLNVSGGFDTLTDAQIQKAIDDALASLEETSWCAANFDPATENLAAHLLALRLGGSNGVAGPVTSQSADGISQSFGAAASSTSTSAAYYQLTVWGQEYWRLLRLQPTTPLVGCSIGASLYRC